MLREEDLQTVIAELKETSEKLIALAALLQKHAKDETAKVDTDGHSDITEKPVTLEEVRGVLATRASQGLTNEVRALLRKFGANKLSEIAPDNFKALYKEAEAIVHVS